MHVTKDVVPDRTWRNGEFPWLPAELVRGARCRVIADNDFAGDPDDLWQLAHHLLSPSVDVRAVVSSRLNAFPGFPYADDTVGHGCTKIDELLTVMGLHAGDDLVVRGSETALSSDTEPIDSPAARAIVAEAMRDVETPLYVTCGGGLTEIASAYLLEPRIADRLTLVWIGGPEYPGHAEPPAGTMEPEYNLGIDPVAAAVVFNRSSLRIWQVPRNAYRQCLVADSELHSRVAGLGDFGAHLWGELQAARRELAFLGVDRAETYGMGDSPLVLLTALQSGFDPDPASSDHVVVPAPTFDDRAGMHMRADGRPIRVYTRIDNRLMFEDMFAKFTAFARWRQAAGAAG
jgi:purine nucleosidase